MKEEFFISQCIRWNKQLRKAICDLAGITFYADDPNDTLSEFHGEANLMLIAIRLGCDPEDVFVTLKAELADMLGVELPSPSLHVVQRPRELANEDLNLFLNDEFLNRLADALGCLSEWQQIFDSLIDSDRLMTIVTTSGISHPDEDTASSELFLRMISRVGIRALEKRYGGPVDMWDVIDSVASQPAKAALAGTYKCSPTEALALLAIPTGYHEVQKPRALLNSKGLDTLATAKMLELVKAIGGTFLKDAQAVASELTRLKSIPGPHLRLQSAIEFFGLRRYRSALLSALVSESTVGSFVERFERISSTRDSKPYLFQTKLTSEGQPTLLISYKPAEAEKWEGCVRLYFAGQHQAKHVEDNLPKRADQLSSQGDTLHERILTCPIPSMMTPAEKVWLKWSAKDVSIIQYFVLAGHVLPDDFGVRQRLKAKDDNIGLNLGHGITRCGSPQEILDSVLSRFKDKGIAPKVV